MEAAVDELLIGSQRTRVQIRRHSWCFVVVVLCPVVSRICSVCQPIVSIRMRLTTPTPFDAALSDWTQVEQLGQHVKVCLIACAHPDEIAFDELGAVDRRWFHSSGYDLSDGSKWQRH